MRLFGILLVRRVCDRESRQCVLSSNSEVETSDEDGDVGREEMGDGED